MLIADAALSSLLLVSVCTGRTYNSSLLATDLCPIVKRWYPYVEKPPPRTEAAKKMGYVRESPLGLPILALSTKDFVGRSSFTSMLLASMQKLPLRARISVCCIFSRASAKAV